MSRRVRRPLSAPERAELWRRWKQGQTVNEIARALGRWKGPLRWALKEQGGICPRGRRRAQLALTLAQREEISRGICAQASMRTIAKGIGKEASTVSREIRRNGGVQAYRATAAEAAAWARARRPKRCLLRQNARLCRRVAQGLMQQWSPQQIAQRLEQDYPNDHSMRVSHETIYRSLFIQARGVLKKELMQHLRSGRTLRHSRHATNKGQSRGQIVEAVSISERPAEAADRAVPGHWEGDLLSGARNSHLATLVERHSRFVMLVKVPSKETAVVVPALAKKITKLPSELRRSITSSSASPPTCRCISVIRIVPGSAAATRTPMAYCASTSPGARTFPCTPRFTSMRSPTG
jgi:IS30 family transposase